MGDYLFRINKLKCVVICLQIQVFLLFVFLYLSVNSRKRFNEFHGVLSYCTNAVFILNFNLVFTSIHFEIDFSIFYRNAFSSCRKTSVVKCTNDRHGNEQHRNESFLVIHPQIGFTCFVLNVMIAHLTSWISATSEYGPTHIKCMEKTTALINYLFVSAAINTIVWSHKFNLEKKNFITTAAACYNVTNQFTCKLCKFRKLNFKIISVSIWVFWVNQNDESILWSWMECFASGKQSSVCNKWI